MERELEPCLTVREWGGGKGTFKTSSKILCYIFLVLSIIDFSLSSSLDTFLHVGEQNL